MAARLLNKPEPGSAFAYLIDKADDAEAPVDLSERPDHYLYGSGYEEWRKAQQKGERKKKRGSG
jgi:hypothetical protein